MCGPPCLRCHKHVYAHGPTPYGRYCLDCYVKNYAPKHEIDHFRRRANGKYSSVSDSVVGFAAPAGPVVPAIPAAPAVAAVAEGA